MSKGTERRRRILAEIEACVCRDRQDDYGDAEDNFADIARLANVVLGPSLKKGLTPSDVAAFMICVKLARIKSNPHILDHWIDAGGYAACGGGIIMSLDEEPDE